MGTILSIETTSFKPSIPIPPADEAYLLSKKSIDENRRLDQEINNLSKSSDRFNELRELQSQAYEDCKARAIVAMLSGHTSTMCLDSGMVNEHKLRQLGYNLYQPPVMDGDCNPVSPDYRLRVNWGPKTT